MSDNFEIIDTLKVISCYTCGIRFAIPDRFDDCLRDSGNNFFCPSGHTLSYSDGKNLPEWRKSAIDAIEELKKAKTHNLRLEFELDQLKAGIAEFQANSDHKIDSTEDEEG